MPSLILSSRYTSDSQLLRQTAQTQGWETVRIDGSRVPDWFDPPDDQIAMFYTAPHAFDIAAQLSRRLLGCHPGWTVDLPQEFLLRELRQMTLAEALDLPREQFVKHSVAKAFPAAVYDASSLAEATSQLQLGTLVHVGEPVDWSVEYRAFVLDGEVATLSPYRRHGEVIQDHESTLGSSESERESALDFARAVLRSPEVAYPPAFVLDVGEIAGRGWAVVEFNECWASGIYACDPERVLATLLKACVPEEEVSRDRQWDFKRHYFSACP